MLRCPVPFRMRRRKRMRTVLISTLDKLISCFEMCRELSHGPWKLWLFASIFVVLLFTGVWQLFYYDPCDSVLIKAELCRQYRNGEIAGNLCYPMCIQDTSFLSYCQTSDKNQKRFIYHQTVFDIKNLDQSDHRWKLEEGTQMSTFKDQIKTFLLKKLGHSMFNDIPDKLLQFADFNEDGKLSLGEAQSIWQLVHIHEFLLLFIFRNSSTFPNINGTCGHIFAFQHTPISRLYDKDPDRWISKLFPNSYKWEFPNWPKRARISLGMVEFSMDIFEEQGVRFHMCNVSPVKFGITYEYEAMLLSLQDIASEEMLRANLQNRTCSSEAQCRYSKHCLSSCSSEDGRCSGEIIRPSLWFICDILHEYLLFDAPKHIYYELKRLLRKCSELTMVGSGFLQHAVVYEDLKTFLWKEIQYNPQA